MPKQLGSNRPRIAMCSHERRIRDVAPRPEKPGMGFCGPDKSIRWIPKDRRSTRLNGLRNEAPTVGFATRCSHEHIAWSHLTAIEAQSRACTPVCTSSKPSNGGHRLG
jgi:hypothetical protein